jgi:phage/plasmid-associated DNA primase
MALVFQETVNPDFVKYFAKMTFAEFRDIYSGVKDKQGVHSILKKTCKQFCKENPISRKFDFTKGKPWGRRVSVNGGCQGLPKVFRGALCNGVSTDVDMMNCHFKILLKICQDRKINSEQLRMYCENRENVLSSFYSTDGLTREAAKQLMIEPVNTQYMKHTKYRNLFFKSFDIEMKRIQNTLWEMSDLQYIKEYCDSSKNNVRGSFMSNLLQKIENEIIEDCLPVLSKCGISISFLSFDGFQVLGDHKNNLDLLAALDKVTHTWGITWAYKEHDTTLSLPENYVADTEEWTDADYAEVFIEKFGADYICGANKSYQINSFGIYRDLKSLKKTLRQNLLLNFTYPYLQKNAHLNAVTDMIETVLYKDNIEEQFDLNHKCVGFENGVFDLNTHLFRKAHFDEYVSKTVGYEYKFIDCTDLEAILRDLVEEDCGDYFLWKLGNILRGDDKSFTVLTGKGNNGKTKVVAKCIQDSLGKFFNAVDIGLVKAGGGDNTNNATPQLMKFQDSMLNLVSELPQGIKLSGNKIKGLTGGSTFQGRELYSNDVKSFKARGQVWFDTNDLGEFDEVDQPLKDRLQVIPFPYKFVPKCELDVSNKFLKPIIYDILDKVENYPLKFMLLMLDWYRKPKPDMPESVRLATEKQLRDIDDVEKFVQDMCTTSHSIRSNAAEMYETYRQSGGDNIRKVFNKNLVNRGFEYKVVRINGSSQRAFIGIGLKNQIGGEEDPE